MKMILESNLACEVDYQGELISKTLYFYTAILQQSAGKSSIAEAIGIQDIDFEDLMSPSSKPQVAQAATVLIITYLIEHREAKIENLVSDVDLAIESILKTTWTTLQNAMDS